MKPLSVGTLGCENNNNKTASAHSLIFIIQGQFHQWDMSEQI